MPAHNPRPMSKRRPDALLLGITFICVLLSTPSASARPPLRSGDFQTPSGNIVCTVQNHAVIGPFRGQRTLFCTVFSEASRRGQRMWTMRVAGRPRVIWIAANIETEAPVLAYGRTWLSVGFKCTSQRRGVTCWNKSRHGFFLSREGQRLF
jgi:hypothetical protein